MSARVSPLVVEELVAREVDDIARKALAGDLEARARARRGFEEEVDDGSTAQRGELLDCAVVDLLEALCRVENLDYLICRVFVDIDEVLVLQHQRSPPRTLLKACESSPVL